MPITFEQYISQFEELREYGALAERLKEELHDHFEDSVHSSMVCGTKENDAIQNALHNLGEQRKIIHEFKTIMKFNNKIALWLESLFLGVISIPLYQFVALSFGNIINSLSVTNDPNFVIGTQEKLFAFLLYIFALLLLGIFYFTCTGDLLRFLETRKKAWQLSIALFLPVFIFAILYSFQVTSNIGGFIFYVPVAIFPGIIYFFFLVDWAFKKKRNMALHIEKKKKKSFFPLRSFSQWFPFIVSCFLIPIIFVSNKNFVPLDSSYNRSFIDFCVFLRNIFESINLPILDFHINGAFGGYEGFYILAVLYIFLAGVSLYRIVQFFTEKSALKRLQDFPWFRLTLLIYVFSLFFLVETPKSTDVVWNVPVRNISAEVKKDQLGFMYRMAMYLEGTEHVVKKPLFLYEVKTGANYFSVRTTDNEGVPHGYYLTVKNNESRTLNQSESINDYEISRISGQKLADPFFHGATALPTGLDCIQDPNKEVVSAWQTGPNAGDGDPLLVRYCHKLLYKGKLIYTQIKANRLYQFEIAPENSNFAVLKLETGEYGPQELYLVDLR